MDEWKGGQRVLFPSGHSMAQLKYKAIWDHGRINAERLHLAPCPEGAVRTTLRYVELDSAGARESSLDFNESDIESLTTWDDEGQDGVVVITGFSLSCASANLDSAVIRVEWQNVGLASREGDSTRLTPTTGGMPSHQDFVVKRYRDVWRLADVRGWSYPHLGPAAAKAAWGPFSSADRRLLVSVAVAARRQLKQ